MTCWGLFPYKGGLPPPSGFPPPGFPSLGSPSSEFLLKPLFYASLIDWTGSVVVVVGALAVYTVTA